MARRRNGRTPRLSIRKSSNTRSRFSRTSPVAIQPNIDNTSTVPAIASASLSASTNVSNDHGSMYGIPVKAEWIKEFIERELMGLQDYNADYLTIDEICTMNTTLLQLDSPFVWDYMLDYN
jgi:hypothetical protein